MVYSSDEVELMVEEAADLIAAGADGLVYGAITSDGLIDTNSCALIKKVGTFSKVLLLNFSGSQNFGIKFILVSDI